MLKMLDYQFIIQLSKVFAYFCELVNVF